MQVAVVTGVMALATMLGTGARAEDAKPAPAKAKSHQFTGFIESVNAEAGSVTVKHSTQKGATKTFKIGETCKFKTAEKSDTTLTAFKAGDKVMVRYTGEEGEQAVATRIEPADSKEKKETAKE
jgi:Cu/Ag efflux protein CusF